MSVDNRWHANEISRRPDGTFAHGGSAYSSRYDSDLEDVA